MIIKGFLLAVLSLVALAELESSDDPASVVLVHPTLPA